MPPPATRAGGAAGRPLPGPAPAGAGARPQQLRQRAPRAAPWPPTSGSSSWVTRSSSLVISEALWERHPDEPEGLLTTRRAAIVSARGLARIAARLDLGRYLVLGQGAERSGERRRGSVLASTFEAVVAAVYLDAGLDVGARRAAPPGAGRSSTRPPRRVTLKSPKSRLQELAYAHDRSPARLPGPERRGSRPRPPVRGGGERGGEPAWAAARAAAGATPRRRRPTGALLPASSTPSGRPADGMRDARRRRDEPRPAARAAPGRLQVVRRAHRRSSSGPASAPSSVPTAAARATSPTPSAGRSASRVASLRTRRAEDLIFAGSSTRRAQGMADVTLVLDNEDRLLPVDFARDRARPAAVPLGRERVPAQPPAHPAARPGRPARRGEPGRQRVPVHRPGHGRPGARAAARGAPAAVRGGGRHPQARAAPARRRGGAGRGGGEPRAGARPAGRAAPAGPAARRPGRAAAGARHVGGSDLAAALVAVARAAPRLAAARETQRAASSLARRHAEADAASRRAARAPRTRSPRWRSRAGRAARPSERAARDALDAARARVVELRLAESRLDAEARRARSRPRAADRRSGRHRPRACAIGGAGTWPAPSGERPIAAEDALRESEAPAARRDTGARRSARRQPRGGRAQRAARPRRGHARRPASRSARAADRRTHDARLARHEAARRAGRRARRRDGGRPRRPARRPPSAAADARGEPPRRLGEALRRWRRPDRGAAAADVEAAGFGPALAPARTARRAALEHAAPRPRAPVVRSRGAPRRAAA